MKSTTKIIGTCITILFLFSQCKHSEYNAKTPMMGWSSWNTFRVDINENLIKETADAMVEKGLKAAGYTFVNIDDGYFGGRDTLGNLQYHTGKFPNGMKAVADYIHAKGLRAGLYSEAGENTCGSIYDNDRYGVGSGLYGYENQDCELFFNQWGYDYIKVDYCGAEVQGLDEKTQYTKIRNAITNSGKEGIRFNVCRWMFPGTWVTEIADSWRISYDIANKFDGNLGIFDIVEKNLYMSAYASPGHFNDMDMMQIGRNTLTIDEEKSHFGLWCILCSPLMIGCDLRTIPQRTLDIITNREIIALNQDPLGLQAQVVSRSGKCIVLAKQIETAQGKVRAVALFNGENAAHSMRINFNDIQLNGNVTVRDLWTKKDVGSFTDYYEISVPAHGTAMLRVEGESSFDKTAFEGEDAFLNNFTAINPVNNARVSEKSNASGGHIISRLGGSPDNWAEFRNVHSSTGGEYELTVYYYSAEERNLSVIINDKEHIMANLNTNDWDTQGTETILIKLRKGNNAIRLTNPTEHAPDIDKIELKLITM
ncbi:Alpha-galactosidase A [termite gut metagenome]|uniref:Alpha-galactosidase A n=1 Tax=termite gut metagenome TaxID=433724 RepID=A0A5J4SHR5_9ZZZZ